MHVFSHYNTKNEKLRILNRIILNRIILRMNKKIDEYRTEYFETYLINEYSLGYFNEKYLREHHTKEEIVQRGILCIYNYLKYIIRHHDNGYANFGTSIDLYAPVLITKETRKFKKYMEFLETEELLHFEFLIFSLALLIRDNDPIGYEMDYEEFIDYEYPNSHSFPSYRLLVAAHEKKINITFTEAIGIILPKNDYYYNTETKMSEREYFEQTYQLLITSLETM